MTQPPAERRKPMTTERHGRTGHGTAFYVLVFITAVLVVNALFGDKGVLAMMQARRDYARLNAELQRQKEENAQLREKVRRLNDDPATIEDLARRNLGLIRPGEKLFIITDVPQPSAPSGPPAPPVPRNP
jgi:cell division protein FtsB